MPREMDNNIKNESKPFEDPKLINYAFGFSDDVFANYSWNTMNETAKGDYIFEYHHEFIDRCYLLKYIKWVEVLKGTLYLSISFVWIVCTFCLWSTQSHPIQKWLTVISLTKFIFTIRGTLVFFTCPWVSNSNILTISMFANSIITVLT